MSLSQTSSNPYRVRFAVPDDVPDLFDMKRKLQASHQAEHALRATPQDWLRDGFGAGAKFTAFVADGPGRIVGMITCSERSYTGWAGSTMYLQDLFVEPEHRKRGIAEMLVARVAAHALDGGFPVMKLTIQKNNPLRRLYDRAGFHPVNRCVSYVASLEAMTTLAGSLLRTADHSRMTASLAGLARSSASMPGYGEDTEG